MTGIVAACRHCGHDNLHTATFVPKEWGPGPFCNSIACRCDNYWPKTEEVERMDLLLKKCEALRGTKDLLAIVDALGELVLHALKRWPEFQ